jgi:hypothetical protein
MLGAAAFAARVHRSANARNPNPHEAVLSMSRRETNRLKKLFMVEPAIC